MKPTTVTLQRFGPMHGWANRILRVDLGAMRIWAQEIAPYVPNYLGARGIAARICWDEYPEPVPPFDPANPLMIMTGALTGSRSPYSGRTNVCAFSPQASPYPWFTRSSVGGYFGGELKRTGYDGIVVTGASDTPVCIRIRDDEVAVLPADDLWGLDIMDCLEALERREGRGTRAMVIGPAGERLSHIATIQTASSSAAGQGGFGGVMGSKKLKAITVAGTGRVSLARPDAIASLSRTLAPMLGERVPRGPRFFGGDLQKLNEELTDEGNGSARCQACTEGCLTPCQAYFLGMPGAVHGRRWEGAWFCVAPVFAGASEDSRPPARVVYDWHLGRNAAFEMNVLSNRYGLNQYDLLLGMVPWLIACQKDGLISDVNGQLMDWNSPQFWDAFLRAVAYSEGMGEVLAKGGWTAAQLVHLGEDLVRYRYPGWGFASHWDGHDPDQGIWFPNWLTPALQWLADTRDPFNSGHCSLWLAGLVQGTTQAGDQARLAEVLESVRAIGERVYQSPGAMDPYGAYEGKAFVGYYHSLRPVIKDCVPVDDLAQFPLIWSDSEPDHFCRLRGIDGIGDIEGPSVEYHLFKAGTGVPWPEEEFDRAAERVCTLERALQVRHWGRDRATDELVLPYFERTETYQNPLLDRRYGLDREQFAPVMDEFYRLHGWDPATARPTAERLQELDMADVYEPMVEGAERAEVARGE